MQTAKWFMTFLTAILLFSLASCNDSGFEAKADNSEVYVWSHNDYEQSKPLTKALEYGFQMIEADIHLIAGELYVSHDHPEDLSETPGLQELYLDPLSKIIENNDGTVLPENSLPFYLVVDIKTDAESTFRRLSEVIEPYSKYFTRLENGVWIQGPIRLLISGNRPELNPDSSNRIAFIDGRISDLGNEFSSELYPVISDNWNNYFTWNGTGEMPEDEYQYLKSLVKQTHSENKLIRFWATDDSENMWATLLKAGVDIINVDDLSGMKCFIDNHYN